MVMILKDLTTKITQRTSQLTGKFFDKIPTVYRPFQEKEYYTLSSCTNFSTLSEIPIPLPSSLFRVQYL